MKSNSLFFNSPFVSSVILIFALTFLYFRVNTEIFTYILDKRIVSVKRCSENYIINSHIQQTNIDFPCKNERN